MMTDPIADMLTRIRNAANVKKTEVSFPYSRMKFTIMEILKKEGYILAVQKVPAKTGKFEDIKVLLKYKNSGKDDIIHDLKRISKPGRRLYVKYREMNSTLNRRGLAILSTPRGLMTSKEAYKQKTGGEIICEIF